MKFEYDERKSHKNNKERGLPFSKVEDFEFDTAMLIEDKRKEYGETRLVAYGMIKKRLHVLCFKPVNKRKIRVISLRKANAREVKLYEKAKNTH